VRLERVQIHRISDAEIWLRRWTDEDGSQPWSQIGVKARRELGEALVQVREAHQGVWRQRGGVNL